jgi:hypothetical protein
MKRMLFLLLALPLLAGCVHTVQYKLTESDRWTGPKIHGTLYVQSFADKSTPLTNKVEHINKEEWRTNYRKGYDTTNLSAQVTAAIVKQLAFSGLFTRVTSGKETNADYRLSGTLADFQTRGRANGVAEGIQAGSAGFGLIGALVGTASTSGMKSEIQTSVILGDLQLAGKSDESLWHDSITVTNDVTLAFQEANEYAVFNHADQALKEAVSEMIRRLGNSSLTNHVKTP